MNLVLFLLPFFCSASLLLPKNISSANSTALISSLVDANPGKVLEVKRLIDDLIGAGEVDRNTATTARNDAQVVKDDAGTALQAAKDQHTQTAGELVAAEQEEKRLTTLEDSKRVAKEAADDAKNAASTALNAAQIHLDTETIRLDEEKATLEHILEMLGTSLGCLQESNVVYWGNDLKNRKVDNSDQCAASCFQDDDCKYWTFKTTDNRCFLKYSDNGRRVMENRISGNKVCGEEQEIVNWNYAQTVGFCRGGDTWENGKSTNNALANGREWDCLENGGPRPSLTKAQCQIECDKDFECSAYDRGVLGEGAAECCLFKGSSTGNGDGRRQCNVKQD